MSAIDEIDFTEDTHTYRTNGTIVPSVTQCLAGCGIIDYSRVPRIFLEKKRWIGQQVHLAIELYEKGELDESTIPPECRGYFDSYGEIRSVMGFTPNPELIEKHIVSEIHEMKYGMTPDLPGMIGNQPWLVELKCTSQPHHKAWAAQMAAYDHGLVNGHSHWRNFNLVAFQLLPTGKRAKPHYYRESALNAFINALSIENYKRN